QEPSPSGPRWVIEPRMSARTVGSTRGSAERASHPVIPHMRVLLAKQFRTRRLRFRNYTVRVRRKGEQLSTRAMRWVLAPAILLGGRLLLAQTTPVLPRPSYDNSVYVLFSSQGLTGDDVQFRATADAIARRVPGGPYARVGLSGFFLVDMD